MKKPLILLTLLGALCISCTKKEEIGRAPVEMRLMATIEAPSGEKTYIPSSSTNSVYWTSKDKLYVFGQSGSDIQQVTFTSDFTTACSSGEFSTDSWPQSYIPIYAVNSNGAEEDPSGLTCTSEGIIRVFVNTTQKITNSGSYGQQSSASVGAVSVNGGVFRIEQMLNVPSLLRFQVSRTDITEVVIESIGGETMAGYADVDYATMANAEPDFWTAVSSEKSISLTVTGSAASEGCFKPGTYYCACVLPQTYEQGFKITMTAADGKVGVREIDKPLSMPRSRIRTLSKSVDDGIEFKEVRTIKTLDFTTISGGTFKYSSGGTAVNLPQRSADCIPAGTDFWGESYPSCKFNGAVRYWTAGGGALNMKAGTYVRFPKMDGYKLTSVTGFTVVHSAVRNYKICSAPASTYSDGVAVKGGEEQSLSSSTAATSFVLKDKYDKNKDYYLVCNSEAGFKFKLVYTPDDQLDPESAGDAPMTVARWRIKSTDLTAAKLAAWDSSNSFPALSGDYANEAFISSSAGTVRTAVSNQLAVGNLNSGDAVEFTVPVSGLAAGSSVDFMTTLRAGNSGIPKYWIFEYLDGGEWKSVEADLHPASDDSGVNYSLFMTTEDDIFTTFCQNFSIATAIEGEGYLKMRLRAVGTKNCDGAPISPSASSCLCFATYSNYYVSCEIAIYRGIPVKDTIKALFIGNSYTYYNGSYFMFKEIARSQGHDIRLRAAIRGGKDMGEHIGFVHVQSAIAEAGYDYAFLQESALYVAKYFDGIREASLNDCREVVNQIRAKSSSAKCCIEDCWSCPTEDGQWRGYGSYAAYQRSLLGGALSIASQTSSWITPVGIGFQRAYDSGFSDLWNTADYSHPSLFGSYIKALVLYYLVYGEELDANVPDCGINASTASLLRGFARSAVLEKGNRAKCMAPDLKDIDTF